ncbi:phage major capsid protein, P2 family [Idiomarina sp.]|uniref:phage major capsid protein, P2 family n=1 Tax=Idiomarina sp. TaxID=1874361 RepID=UPI001D998279|nr:phage major capsid protein, P2 family [Idiomarina sp.]MCJ8317008.1 phage major capsid protein, P2 family [Idiomarina sp.]NQZ17371.1 phage major capsid protein, P2 family [Idiomarina sp.]
MRNETRKLFNDFQNRLATLNGVESVGAKFTVEPSVQQTLETRMQESSEFLNSINVIGVNEQQGEKLGLGISGTIAGRTDTNQNDRQPTDPTDMEGSSYFCKQTNFDTALRYGKLDAWAKFQDFQTRIRDAILKRQALDRIMIGFNGTSAATQSDRTANPLLQDVNIGWLQKMRDHAAERVMTEVVEASGKITVGTSGDYKNLDALVYDMVNNLIDPWHQDDTELVVLTGRKLLSDKYFPLVNSDLVPTEKTAADMMISQKRIGGLQAVRVPHFPANTIMVTRLDNLSLYWQEGSRRRNIIDNPKRDQIENYESSNDAYVVEDYGCAAVAENIELS